MDCRPALLPVEVPAHEVVLDDGRRLTVAPPPSTRDSHRPVRPEPTGAVPGPTPRTPLGVLVRAVLPEAAHLEVVRHELPRRRAVHLVKRGLLGTGGSSNTRVDQVGGAVGEFLRWVDVLDELLAPIPLITPIPTTEASR